MNGEDNAVLLSALQSLIQFFR